jgi:pimeloyl-ACP methyl ester carboxylesterase
MSFIETPDGCRLRISDRGAGGPPVVLVHGWKGSHRLWDRTIVALQEHCRVIAFDLRGMGESDKPRCAYDFDELSGDLAFVLDALDLEDVTLVGWSMGCTVSLRHLERGAPRVGRLMLINGPLRLTRTDDFPHAMTADQLEGYLAGLAASWPTKERAFQAETLRTPDPALADWLYSIALQTPLDVVLATCRAQMRLDLRSVVAGARVPVLAAYARHDPYYPVSLGEFIARTAPDGQLVVFEESAHGVPLEEPRKLAATIRGFAAG